MKFEQSWAMIVVSLIAGLVGIVINHFLRNPVSEKALKQASENTITVAEPAFPAWFMAAVLALIVGFVLGSWTATALTSETNDRNTDQ